MTKDSALYKWGHRGVGRIQSGFAILSTHLLTALLSCWHWTTNLASICRQKYPPIATLENYLRTSWNSLYSTMTVEVISTPLEAFKTADSSLHSVPLETQPTTTILPVLRLNSVAMDDYLNEPNTKIISTDDSAEFVCSSNYNSNSDDCDSGLVCSDPDENELSSDDAGFRDEVLSSNRIPQEPFNSRRDSDSSDISSDGQEINETETKEITKKLINQVETMFSDEHLAKDGFLLKHVRRRSDGFVSLKLVAGLRKVKQISRDFPTVLSALKESGKLEVNAEGTKIRRLETLTSHLKSLPVGGGNKEKETKTFGSNGASSDSAQDDRVIMRNGYNHSNNYQQRRNQHRNNSVISTGSSGSSRHGSFCNGKPGQSSPEPLFRNMMVYMPDEPQVIRRRGGSLPMPSVMSAGGQQHYYRSPPEDNFHQKRNSMFLCTNPAQSDSSNFQVRPKSNSYCEGIGPRANGGTSLWLQRRMESTRAASEGSVVISGVVRQPRGPDGTRGFAAGYRRLIAAM